MPSPPHHCATDPKATGVLPLHTRTTPIMIYNARVPTGRVDSEGGEAGEDFYHLGISVSYTTYG